MGGPDNPKPPDPLALLFAQAIAALTPEQWQDLYRYARWLMRGVTVIDLYEAMDLIQDAIKRTLEGKRHWNPEKTDVVFYLKSTVRSIANASFRKIRRTLRQHIPLDENLADQSPFSRWYFSERGHEQAAEDILDELYRQLREEGDHIAESVLQSLERGYPPRKARQLLSMDADTYNAARKRIKRRMQTKLKIMRMP